jgi:hypothetical protein
MSSLQFIHSWVGFPDPREAWTTRFGTQTRRCTRWGGPSGEISFGIAPSSRTVGRSPSSSPMLYPLSNT